MKLLMPGTSVSALRTLTRAVRSVINPASLFEPASSAAPVSTVVDTEPQAGMFGPDELPPVEDIAAAASVFMRAAEQARAADRGKRAARKLLDRLPAGLYGGWQVERTPSARQTADLDEIRRTYKRLGLGPVPMKASAPSLKVSMVVPAVAPIDQELAVLAAALRVPAVAR